MVPHRSVSQLTTYTSCGEQYRLQRVAKSPEKPAAWTIHGSAFHYAIEEYELSSRSLSVDECRELFFTHYDNAINEAKEKEPDLSRWLTGGNKKAETDIADRRAKGADQVNIYIDYAQAHNDEWRILQAGPRGVAVELEFNIQFGGVNVLGFIDQIRHYRDGRIVPTDLKSGTKEPASGFQLAVYAHAINENMGILPDTGAFFMPKLKRDGTLVGDVWKTLTQWNKPLLDVMFQQFDAAERAGIYLPNPGDGCRTCSVAESCKVNGNPEQVARFATITTRAS